MNPRHLANELDGRIDSSTEYSTLRVMIDMASADSRRVTISVNDLASLTFTSRSTMIRTIRSLTRKNLITNLTSEENTTKTYQVNVGGPQ